MRKYINFVLCLVAALLLTVSVSASDTEAPDISAETKYTATGYAHTDFLKNKATYDYQYSDGSTTITLENPNGMASLYLMFNLEYGEYTVTDNISGKAFAAGTYNFLHEFIDLTAAFGVNPTSVTLDFSKGAVTLCEIYVFGSGETPAFVQKWEPPLDGCADILLMPTHGDDDHLYFAGLLPYYAGELDCAVQVAYLTNHRNDTPVRFHEILNGLWATGVENYPVFAFKWDFRVDDLKESYRIFTNFGVSDEDLMRFVVEQFRRFKPQVVVTHDVDGEYGHGMHLVYADIVMRGVELSNNPEVFPDIADKYGLWDVPKTYLHLWEENPIVIDYDIPLEHFGGLTAFQVTQKYGFPCHQSQHIYNAFTDWLYGHSREITKATEIKTYNPAHFGLYRSIVGTDVEKNDLLENVTTYADQARLEQERLKQERLEKERQEQERLEQERLEKERLEQEQTQPTQHTISQEQYEAELERIKNSSNSGSFGVLLALVGLVVICVMSFKISLRFAKQNLVQSKRIDPKESARKNNQKKSRKK